MIQTKVQAAVERAVKEIVGLVHSELLQSVNASMVAAAKGKTPKAAPKRRGRPPKVKSVTTDKKVTTEEKKTKAKKEPKVKAAKAKKEKSMKMEASNGHSTKPASPALSA